MPNILIPCRDYHLPAVIHLPPTKYDYVCIFSHGFRGSKDGGGRAVKLAEDVANEGLAVLRYDFSPLQNLSWQIKELQYVVGFVRRELGKEIILLGRSMGGSASLAYTVDDKNIRGLCLWSTPWDLNETFQLALGQGYDILRAGQSLDISDEFGSLQLTPSFIRDFSQFNLLQAIKKLNNIPLLIVHGTDDEIVPLPKAKMLFQCATEPKKLAVVAGGDHRFLNGFEQANQSVIDWIKQFIK